MKKSIILFASMLVILAGCGKQPEEPTVSQVPVEESQDYTDQISDEELEIYQRSKDTGPVDLTILNSTMVYGQIFDMMMKPDNYVGRTIKVQGMYDNGKSDETGKYYHFIVIKDATACCAQGLEFLLDEAQVYPQDYPVIESEIELEGIYSVYYEDDYPHYYIAVDKIATLETPETPAAPQ